MTTTEQRAPFDPAKWLRQVENDGSEFIVRFECDPQEPMDQSKWTYSVLHYYGDAESTLSCEEEIALWTEYRQPGAREAVRAYLIATREFAGKVAPSPTHATNPTEKAAS